MNKEHNPIKAVATTDGELIVLADNNGFHVIPTDKVLDALKPYNYVTTDLYAHYRLNKQAESHLVANQDDHLFYPGQLSELAQAFAAELWARFVDGDVSHKPGILEQLQPTVMPMKTQATVQWRQMPELFVTLEHEGKSISITIHADSIWPVLKPYQVNGTNFLYRLKDGSTIDIWQMDKSNFDIWTMSEAERNAPITRLVNEYLPELWEVFGHRAQPFTPDEPWLPGILEQL